MNRTLSIGIALVLGCALSAPALAEGVDGKALYASKCAMCHGADGVAKTMAKGSANFNDPSYAAGPVEIVKVTMEGRNKMPKFDGKLKPEEANAVAEYIKTLAPKK